MIKKCILLLFLFLILINLSSAVPDLDQDGVPDANDNCPNSDSTVVDQFGCSCEQKNCPLVDANKPCISRCGVINGIPTCGAYNNNECQGGICKMGACVPFESATEADGTAPTEPPAANQSSNASSQEGTAPYNKPYSLGQREEFAMVVSPAKEQGNEGKMLLYFSDKLGIDTKSLAKLMGNSVAYDKNSILMDYGAEDMPSRFAITKSRNGTIRVSSFEGFIIELEEKPLIVKEKEIIEKAQKNENKINSMSKFNPLKYVYRAFLTTTNDVPEKVQEHLEDIRDQREKVKSDIKNELGNDANGITGNVVSDSNLEVMGEYEKVFNGFALAITEDDAKKITDVKGIKKVYPNNKVEATLTDSVHLINADKVWSLDSNGDNCGATGKECITGKGVTIAIIDTGVDYAHEDLGGCFGGSSSEIARGNIKVGGSTYLFESASDINQDNFLIKVDMNGNSIIGDSNSDLETEEGDIIYTEYGDEDFTEEDIVSFILKKGETFRVLQYLWATAPNSSNPVIVFKDIETKETIERPYSLNERSYAEATIKLGGLDYMVRSNSPFFSYNTVVNFDIVVDFDASGTIGDYELWPVESGERDKISKSSYFFIPDYGILQYVSADKKGSDNPVLTFVDKRTGDTIETPYEVVEVVNRDCKVIGGYDFVNRDNDPMDDQGHGTHVAATAAGNGRLKGVAPDANILAYKVLNQYGSGSFNNVIRGIERAVDPNNDGDFSDNADIISMSLGANCGGNYDEYCGPDDPVSQAVDNAVNKGVVAVIAAGNSGPYEGTIGTPGTARKAITVGASDKTNKMADFSSRGPVDFGDEFIIKPDIVAPGVEICAALSSQHDPYFDSAKCLDNSHMSISGTSMATPHIAGAAALLLQSHTNWTPEDVKSALMLNSRDLGYDLNSQGTGLADVEMANSGKILVAPSALNFKKVIDKLPAPLNITIKNEQNAPADIGIRTNCTWASLSKTGMSLGARQSDNVQLSASTFPEEGFNVCKLSIYSGNKNYSLPYTSFSTSLLILNVESGRPRELTYSDVAITNDDLTFYRYKFDATKSTSFTIPSGKYIAYAGGDVNDVSSVEYMLMKEVDVPKNSRTTVTLDIKEAKPMLVKARSISGEKLLLYEWQKAFMVYNNQGYNNQGCLFGWDLADPAYGDKTVYVSKRPTDNFDVDVFFKYDGVPSRTAPKFGSSGFSRTFYLPYYC